MRTQREWPPRAGVAAAFAALILAGILALAPLGGTLGWCEVVAGERPTFHQVRHEGAEDLIQLTSTLQALQANPALIIDQLTYQVRMAAAGAGCFPDLDIASRTSALDEAVARTYRRLGCVGGVTPRGSSRLSSPLPARHAPKPELRVRADPEHGRVLQTAIRLASKISGVAPAYLWTTARLESGFRFTAEARTSSAVGPFQFLSSTWLVTLRRYGSRLGMDRAAAAIELDPMGRPSVRDPLARRDILALRADPIVAATLAGLLTRENATALQARAGDRTTADELYAAHVLGPAGTLLLYRAAEEDPETGAAALLPVQAAANPGLFLDRGRGITSLELVQAFRRRTAASGNDDGA